MKKYRFRYSLSEMTARLFRYAAPIRGYLTVSTLASIIGNLSHMGLMGSGAMWILCAAGVHGGDPSFYMILTAVFAVLIAVCRYLEGVFSHIGAYGILAKLRIHLFRCLDSISPAYMVDRKKGDVLNIAVSDIETLEFFFAHMIGPMFTVFLLPITSLIIAGSFSPLYVAALLPVYILISVVIPLIALRTGRSIGMNSRVQQGELRSLILESVYGIRDIQIFGNGQKRQQKVMEQNERVNSDAHRLTMHREAVSAAPNFFIYLARILLLVAASYLAGRGINDPVGIVVVSFVSTASFSSTFSLTSVVSNLLETYAAAERMFIIEDARPEAAETSSPSETGPVEEIEFRDVTFRYPDTDRDILRDCSLKVKKGERIGILGDSGVGKTTIFRLLLRFYDPDKGSITVNGTDIRDVSFRELRSGIAMLEQETYLFDATVAENILMGNPGASEEDIRAAAARAGISELIDSLPDGYDTQMGQMAARLSGGERQRIGIARVLIADPDVIVMDEPTSSLDVMHEKELLRTLRESYSGKTVIIISHRMSTLSGCDTLYRLEQGRLIPYVADGVSGNS